MDKPNFINYDMLEVNSSQDIITYGEQVVYGLEQHKDVKFSVVENQVAQLTFKFDNPIVTKLKKAFDCQIVEGVDIKELKSVLDLIEGQANKGQGRSFAR